jgi:uncharacterized protein (DUF2062 family)
MRRLRRLAQLVLRVEDSATRVALAFGLGVFIAFFPVLGTHTAIALAFAVTFRLNRVAILAGAWMNNPWTIGPMLTAGTLVGCAVLGVSPKALGAVDWGLSGRDLFDSLVLGFRPLLWPFVVGNLVVGTVAGAASFLVVRAVLKSRRARTAQLETGGAGV